VDVLEKELQQLRAEVALRGDLAEIRGELEANKVGGHRQR
jgi:hypothetical protein